MLPLRPFLVAATIAIAAQADAETQTVTLLFAGREHEASAVVADGEIWIRAADLPQATGFELKPQGLCSAGQCVALPADADWIKTIDGEKRVALAKASELLSQALAFDADHNVCALGAVPSERAAKLELGQAPDFTLPDRQGKPVSLSQFRGKKVLLLTWASWCGCSQDLPGWQKIYQELKDKNFELVAAAQDTQGEAAAGKFYDRAAATFTTLIDAEHEVSSLYQMVNVPSGVWIDEQGQIVRPAEVAYSGTFKVFGQQVGDARYVPALYDWVERGPMSEYVMSRDKLKAKTAPRPLALREAEVEFRLGTYLYARAHDLAAAGKHWRRAQELDPDNWNYHRQEWAFEPKTSLANWFKKVRALGARPYYDPVDFEK